MKTHYYTWERTTPLGADDYVCEKCGRRIRKGSSIAVLAVGDDSASHLFPQPKTKEEERSGLSGLWLNFIDKLRL